MYAVSREARHFLDHFTVLLLSTFVLLGCSVETRDPQRELPQSNQPSTGAVDFSSSHRSKNLTPYTETLVDPLGKLTLADVRRTDAEFIATKTESLSFGYTRDVVWVRVRVTTAEPETDVYLEHASSLMDNIEVYQVINGKVVQSFRAGRDFPFGQRPVASNRFVFPLRIEGGNTNEVYVRLKTTSTMTVTLSLSTPKNYLESESHTQKAVGFYYGIIAIMVVYNLLIFTHMRDRTYLYYAFFSLFFALYQASYHGLAFQYLWPDAVAFNKRTPSFLIVTAVLFAIRLVQAFLDTKRTVPLAHVIFRAAFGILLVVLPCIFFIDYYYVVSVILPSIPILVIVALIATVRAVQKGHEPAKIFLLAWGVFLVFSFVDNLRGYGFFPINFLTLYGIQISSALELAILAFALSARMNEMRRTTMAAERALVESNARKFIMEKEMVAAQDFQSTMLPPLKNKSDSFSWRALYKPATQLAGDWFDVREIEMLDGSRLLAVIVVDVTGHGASAAMTTTIASAYWGQICAESHMTPYDKSDVDREDFATHIAQRLDYGLSLGRKVTSCTAFIVLIDGQSDRFSACSCAHPGAVVLTAQGMITVSPPSNGLLGMARVDPREGKWKAISHSLGKQERLVLMTDGLLPHQLGHARWMMKMRKAKNASPDELMKLFFERVRFVRKAYRNLPEEEDDITLVAVRHRTDVA